jgi:hypothetical protein
METQARANKHVKIVVAEKVTLQDLHAALAEVVKHLGGGCNCGLTGFDVTFLRGDPGLAGLTKIPNIQGGMVSSG